MKIKIEISLSATGREQGHNDLPVLKITQHLTRGTDHAEG